jgi:hypothetical protein
MTLPPIVNLRASDASVVSSPSSPSQALALLTLHGKGPCMAPIARELGCELVVVDDFDTDSLGTFTGEVGRAGTQLQAAQRKAELAAQRAGCRYGLGSEGSFGPDPYLGLSAWGTEVVAWHDAQEARFVHAVAQGPDVVYAQAEVRSLDEALDFARRHQFPSHGLVIGRPGEAVFSKDVADLTAFEHRVRAGLAQGSVWLETDMRAHRNPTRMAMIARAADALAARLACRCPGCDRRGFGVVRLVPGACCQACLRPTEQARAQLLQCDACGFEQTQALRSVVPPTHCAHCNP